MPDPDVLFAVPFSHLFKGMVAIVTLAWRREETSPCFA
jgi:hypothetical protein